MSNLAYRETADKMSGAAVNLILNTADSIGIDLQQVLREAGLPPPAREGRDVRLAGVPSPDQQGLVFERLVALLCKQSPQRDAQDSPTADDVNLFCSCLVNCESLERVIERAIRFTRISNNRWGELHCDRDGQSVVFSMDSRRLRNSAGPATLDLLSVAFFYKLFSWLIAEPLRLQCVNLAHDLHADEGVARQVFICPIRPGSVGTALVFDPEMLRKPILRTYRELVEMLERLPVALLPLPRSVSVRDQVELIFNRAMDSCITAPKLEQVAAMLGQSVSTLRRNLLRENTSFQAILDCLRMQRALVLLRDTELTIEELASVLGFSSAGVFSRAFKSWTGQSPSIYRLAAGI
jgi:AraC-like DNA-binding protein